MALPETEDRLAYLGEQALSFMDEIIKTPCPWCGGTELGISFLGKNIVISCSEALNTYEMKELEGICDFTKVIRRANLSETPFILQFTEKRATSQNRAIPKKPRSKK